MRLDGVHEQAFPRPLPHDELARLQRGAAQVRLVADLAGQGDDLARVAGRQARARRGVLGCRDPILVDDQGLVQAALAADHRDGGQPAEVGGSGLGRARPHHLSRRQKTLEVQIPYRRADGPLNLLVDSTGIKFHR